MLCTAVLLTACEKDDKYIEPSDSFSILKTSISLTDEGGNGSIQVSADDVAATSDVDWIHVTAKGKEISVTVDANNDYQSRIGIISLKKNETVKNVPINQLGYLVKVEIASATLHTDGETVGYVLKSRPEVTVTIPEDATTWLSYAMRNDSIFFTAQPYNGILQRSATVTVQAKGSVPYTATYKQMAGIEGNYSFKYGYYKWDDKTSTPRVGTCVIKKTDTGDYRITLGLQKEDQFGLSTFNLMATMVNGNLVLNTDQVIYMSNKGEYLRFAPVSIASGGYLNKFGSSISMTFTPTMTDTGLVLNTSYQGVINGQTPDGIIFAMGTKDNIYTKDFGTINNIQLVKLGNE